MKLQLLKHKKFAVVLSPFPKPCSDEYAFKPLVRFFERSSPLSPTPFEATMTERKAPVNTASSIDLETLQLGVDAIGQLSIEDAQGNRFEDIKPVRLFPLSRPYEWISLVDPAGKEIVCIDNPEKLGDRNKQILLSELEKREFVPILKRVIWVSGNSEPCEWKVETDRGATSFILNDENDVRRLGENGVLVVDSFGIRYFVPDCDQLDSFSRRIIEWYV